MVGESVLIRQKYKDAFPKLWQSPGISIGNVPAAWQDKRGAYSRRLIYNLFEHTVKHKDGELERKCLAELPAIIVKMTRAYLSLVRWMDEIRETDIEQVWPAFYRLGILNFTADNNMVAAFLKSGQVVVKEGLLVPQQLFVKLFQDFCKANGQPAQRYAWDKSKWELVFRANKIVHGLEVEEQS